MTVAGSVAVLTYQGTYSLAFRLCIDFDESTLPWQCSSSIFKKEILL